MLKEGKITKLIGDLYTVSIENEKFDCKARGKFRNDKISPLVGDQILFDIEKKYIMEILPRKNELIRPPIANIDICLIITSMKEPDISYNLIDKLLCNAIAHKIKPIIIITKEDLATKKEIKNNKSLLKYYKKIGIPVLKNYQTRKIKKVLNGKTIVLAGQSGAGKSTLLNKLSKDLNLATGEISKALNRGKHTTRHVEIYNISNFYIADTPGFSALELSDISKEDIKNTFIEFNKFPCEFNDCNHQNSKCCGVIKAYNEGKILKSRYENYINFIERKEK